MSASIPLSPQDRWAARMMLPLRVIGQPTILQKRTTAFGEIEESGQVITEPCVSDVYRYTERLTLPSGLVLRTWADLSMHSHATKSAVETGRVLSKSVWGKYVPSAWLEAKETAWLALQAGCLQPPG